jgi:hypothetical protein
MGTLVKSGSAFAYTQFADWWARSLAAYAGMGVVPDYISIQNEPDYYNVGWETCLFDATEGTNAGYGKGRYTIVVWARRLEPGAQAADHRPRDRGDQNMAIPKYFPR